jgi:hypothetical protein
MERTIRVTEHISGPLKDTIVEVVEAEGGCSIWSRASFTSRSTRSPRRLRLYR